MNDRETLDKDLTTLGENLNARPSVADSVMQRIAADAQQPRRTGRAIPRLALACAALLVAVAVSYVVLDGGPTDLRGVVLAALDEARSVHVAAVRLNEDGTEGDGAEVWYDREHGVLQRMTFRDRETVIRDDGTSRLEYTAGADFALKTESTDAMGLVRKVMNVARITDGYERVPSEDRDVDGVPCQCYMDTASDGSSVQVAWVDAEGRLRLCQERTRAADGTYAPDE
ncbi:MAG: hypothetical protein GY851_01315, partial [bacterium]|nr:hypothetical protein [bacterium]